MTFFANKNNQPFLPFLPENSTWEDWNGNFIIYYGQLNIPYNTEENWKNTADIIAETITFSAFPVPYSSEYENWQDWAKEVTLIVNGKSH